VLRLLPPRAGLSKFSAAGPIRSLAAAGRKIDLLLPSEGGRPILALHPSSTPLRQFAVYSGGRLLYPVGGQHSARSLATGSNQTPATLSDRAGCPYRMAGGGSNVPWPRLGCYAMLIDAVQRTVQGAAAAFAVLGDAKDDQGVAFYLHNEFRALVATMKVGPTTAPSQKRPGHRSLSGARPARSVHPRSLSLLRRDADHPAAPDRVPALF